MDTGIEPPILLVDKYSPSCVKEIIGSGRDTSVANKLIRWLNGWFSTHRATGVKANKPTSKGIHFWLIIYFFVLTIQMILSYI